MTPVRSICQRRCDRVPSNRLSHSFEDVLLFWTVESDVSILRDRPANDLGSVKPVFSEWHCGCFGASPNRTWLLLR
jgi:hypothetical protein